MNIEPLQAAIAAINQFSDPNADDKTLLVLAKCRGLMAGYDARWRADHYEVLTVERVYQSPMFNPETQRKSRRFSLAGKLDVFARKNGRTKIIDHKTTSEDITSADSSYWRQLVIEGQVTQYMLLQWLAGERPDGAVWDVIRKPMISPKKLTKAERASVVADGRYFGRRISLDGLTALQVDERESLEMYEARLSHDCAVERPDWYFQRREIPRMDAEVIDYARDVWDIGQVILQSRERMRDTGRLPLKSPGSCMTYGKPCDFLGICSGYDTPESDRWQRREVVHGELNGEVGNDALTNSRIRCFQTCQRKHYYRYELGIERREDDEREALYFGSCLHAGLEAWWKCFLIEPQPLVEQTLCQ